MNFDRMTKSPDRLHIYEGCYADLILGTGIAVTYFQFGNEIMAMTTYHESSTINRLDLIAVCRGFTSIETTLPYTLHTNSKYVSTVMQHIYSWRNQGTLESKVHSDLLGEIVEKMDKLGNLQLRLSVRQWERDDVMCHLLKYAKHCYHRIQMEIIEKLTTDLPTDSIANQFWKVPDLAGSIVWKTPLSMSEFQKKMEKSRRASLEKEGKVRETNVPFLKLVE